MKRSWLVGLAALASFAAGCRPRDFHQESGTLQTAQCDAAVDAAAYVGRRVACYAGSLESKRHLYPWIPCNRAEILAHAADPADTLSATMEWLKRSPPFSASEAAQLFENSAAPNPAAAGLPVLESPIHKAIAGIIREAKETVFVDVFLLGGRWGVEIVRELLRAQQERGVKVLVVRDVENPFFFRDEIDPLMDGMVAYGMKTPGFTAMRAQIHRRPSFLPWGIDNVIKPFFGNTDRNNSPLLQSDHSKTIVVDGLTDTPKMLVGSKNMTDFGAAINFDEVVRIDGPAAAAVQLAYSKDIEMALELAKREGKASDEDQAMVGEWLAEIQARLAGRKPALAKPQGRAEVRMAENNADDSIKNVEHTVVNLIESAQQSVKFYGMGMIPYSLAFDQALARAIKRGVRVQPLLDSQMGLNTGMTLLEHLKELGAYRELAESEARWRTLLPVHRMSDGRPDLSQQQHTKTILIDDRIVFLGSANQDAATFEGDFREFSVAIRNSDAVAQAVRNFAAVYDSPKVALPVADLLDNPSLIIAAREKGRRDALMTALRLRAVRVGIADPEKTQAGCE